MDQYGRWNRAVLENWFSICSDLSESEFLYSCLMTLYPSQHGREGTAPSETLITTRKSVPAENELIVMSPSVFLCGDTGGFVPGLVWGSTCPASATAEKPETGGSEGVQCLFQGVVFEKEAGGVAIVFSLIRVSPLVQRLSEDFSTETDFSTDQNSADLSEVDVGCQSLSSE